MFFFIFKFVLYFQNVYYPSPRNPNLIAIVPVDGPSPLQQIELTCPATIEKTEQHVESYPQSKFVISLCGFIKNMSIIIINIYFHVIMVSEVSKFHRFNDNGSASEEEDTKEQKGVVTSTKPEIVIKEESNEPLEMDSQEETTESSQKNGEDQKEDGNDDDDDILLMADLEEEDSLERLMDEMEREMNVDKPSEKREKRSNKAESKNAAKNNEENKNSEQRMKSEDSKKDRYNATVSSLNPIVRGERRSVSPHITNRVSQKRRSLSPKPRSRKKSPRRSPRRSPIRQQKRSPRDTRYRSPRRSPSRYSPRSRSPKLSPRRSPNRTSMKRSPPRKLSPRGRSPKFSSRSRSPRPQRSPRRSRSKSPRSRTPKMRSRSPRLSRSRSPRYSPVGLSPLVSSPRSKSPRSSPRRMSPRRLPSRSRSPGLSPPRRGSSRLRSPKVSPRRTPPRARSPRLSPRRSPWSSPRHSPRLPSPRRRRSPKWSPKELPRKRGRSVSPDNSTGLLRFDTRESSPTPEVVRTKAKQKEETYERPTIMEGNKEPADTINDPILEARRKKFESTRPIDPVNANKKIKLCKKHTTNAKTESLIGNEIESNTVRKVNKITEEYNIQETGLCVETTYEFEELEGTENTSPDAVTSSVNACIDVESQQTEKEKPSKKKKKRDKELYQVGKLKNELPLSERIGKDKKCKKRKELVSDDPNEDVDAIFEDITIEEEGDLRTELSRRRAERLNRTVPIQSARLVQSAFKGVVNE